MKETTTIKNYSLHSLRTLRSLPVKAKKRDMPAVREAVKQLYKRGYTQTKIAKYLGVKQPWVSTLINGRKPSVAKKVEKKTTNNFQIGSQMPVWML